MAFSRCPTPRCWPRRWARRPRPIPISPSDPASPGRPVRLAAQAIPSHRPVMPGSPNTPARTDIPGPPPGRDGQSVLPWPEPRPTGNGSGAFFLGFKPGEHMGRDTPAIADLDTARLCPRPDLGAALAVGRRPPPLPGHSPHCPPARVLGELSYHLAELLAVPGAKVNLVLLAVEAKRKASLLPFGNHFIVVVTCV